MSQKTKLVSAPVPDGGPIEEAKLMFDGAERRAAERIPAGVPEIDRAISEKFDGGDDAKHLYEGKGKKRIDQIHAIVTKLLHSLRFLRNGQELYHIPSEPHQVQELRPMKPADLSAALATISEVMDDQGYVILTSKSARAVMRSDNILRLPEVRGIARHPIYGPNYQRPRPGVRTDYRLFQATRQVTAVSELKHLPVLLSGFHLDPHDGSLANLLGQMISLLLVPALGSTPLTLFAATRPGEGKTLLARTLAILFGEPEPSTVRYKSDSVLEKDIGAAIMAGDLVVIIDNVRVRGRIDSPLLEALVTDASHAFRVLGTSKRVKMLNLGMICLTANNVMLHEDLASRAVVVNFRSDTPPSERSFEFNPAKYAADYREEILGELLGLVESWKSAGMPEPKIEYRFRNPTWAAVIGSILEIAGIKGFLSNHGTEDRGIDQRRVALSELGLRHLGDELSVGGWLDLMEREGFSLESLGITGPDRSRKALESIVGHYMVETVGITEIIGDKAVKLHCEDLGHARGKLYRFEAETRGNPSTSVKDFAARAGGQVLEEGGGE